MYSIPVPIPISGSSANAGSSGNPSAAQAATTGGNSKRRLAAERAAIRQRVRDDLAKQQNAIKRQREFSEKTRVWNDEIIPMWDELGKSQRVRDLCIRGIPPNIRGKVWPILIGNSLEVTEELFESLNREVQILFSDKMSAARMRKSEEGSALHTSYVLGSSFTESVGSIEDRADRAISKDIPIPKDDTHIDVTEEAWFQNERDGSLDQESFQTIQKQLFGNPSYLMNRMMSSPSRTTSTCDAQFPNDGEVLMLQQQTPETPDMVKADPAQKSPLPFPLDFDGSESTPNEKEREDEDILNFLNPSGEACTPPRRQRHTTTFLVDAGLLQEAAATPQAKGPSENVEQEEVVKDPKMEKVSNAVSLIQWDLPRTFPTLAFFHDGGAMHTGLERVLLCFALYRPDIGYVQGMSFLVATLLLYMDEYETFKCLSNMLARRIYSDFYGLRKQSIDGYVLCFDYYFKKFLPLLYNHMRSEGVTSEMFLMDWNLSLFTKALPLEVAAQVWDVYLYEGEIYIMYVGLGILKMYAPILSKFSVEKISPFLLHLPDNIKAEELFNYIAQINIPRKQYERIRKKMIDESEVEDGASQSKASNIRQTVRNKIQATKSSIRGSLSRTIVGSSATGTSLESIPETSESVPDSSGTQPMNSKSKQSHTNGKRNSGDCFTS